MKLELNKIAESNFRVIPVPESKISGRAREIKEIVVGKDVYTVHDAISYVKGEVFPLSIAKLGYGREVTPEQLWDTFKKSEVMYFFIVEIRPTN